MEQRGSRPHPVEAGRYNDIVTPDIPDGTHRLFVPFIESCPLAIAIKDAQMKIQYCNSAYSRLVKKPRAKLIGKISREALDLGRCMASSMTGSA